MRIAMMSAWNTDSGVAVHAQPIGRAWIKMGHKLTVFSFIWNDSHGAGFTGKDEDYVIRCFGTQEHTNFLDPRPLLTKEFDIFIVQDLRMLPVEKLAKIFHVIKQRAKTIHIVHENKLPEEAWFYLFDWDKVIYFDQRQDFLKKVYPNAQFIPFPCAGIRKVDKIEARKRLGLPLDKKIIYSFCQRGYDAYLRDLPQKIKDKAVLLHVISKGYQMLEERSCPEWMIIRKEDTLSRERFDDYLFASDVAIFHKFQKKSRLHAVVSSTVFQALGCGCPVFVPGQSDFFHPFKDEVIRYGDIEELNKKLLELLEDEEKYQGVVKQAEEFVLKNSPERIAERYIGLFTEVLRAR
ncbi:MAG: glycosyltransferase [Candidatus Mariimomonas ferrooxydans]